MKGKRKQQEEKNKTGKVEKAIKMEKKRKNETGKAENRENTKEIRKQ